MWKLSATDLSSNPRSCLLKAKQKLARRSGTAHKTCRCSGDIANKIPSDINWVLQADGHTDDVPIRAGRYADNWDLSTERALSVVRYLNQQGLPANRLAAAGYGEFQPLNSVDSDDARRKNRRIELKITQRVAPNED